jgi:hypothetical protein
VAVCTNPHRPFHDGVRCICGSTVGFPSFACGHGEVCLGAAAATARCAGVAGRPCWADVACASGKCVDHLCQKAGPSVLCLSADDCLSGVCAADAAGRPVCN